MAAVVDGGLPAARGDGYDAVHSKTGLQIKPEDCCINPMKTATNECSDNVIVNGYGSVRFGDMITPHPLGICACCGTDTFKLDTGALTVIVNKKPMGRLDDYYTDDNWITSGSPNVIVTKATYGKPRHCDFSDPKYIPDETTRKNITPCDPADEDCGYGA